MFTHRTHPAVLFLSGVLSGVVCMAGYGWYRTNTFEASYAQHARELSDSFLEVSLRADRIESTASTTASVRDCAKRARFEQLLATQPLMRANEQSELDSLFDACADYQARLKTHYAYELRAVVERFRALFTLHNTIMATDVRVGERLLALMTAIADNEARMAAYLYEQVELQRQQNDAYARRGTATQSEVHERGKVLGASMLEVGRAIDDQRDEFAQLLDE
jgi:hypothetical protein